MSSINESDARGSPQRALLQYSDDDIGQAYRVGPLCEAGSLHVAADAGRQRWTPTVTMRWSVPRAAAARLHQVGVWKRARHDTKFVVLAFESSGWTVGPARSMQIQYCNTCCNLLQLANIAYEYTCTAVCSVSKSPYLDDG